MYSKIRQKNPKRGSLPDFPFLDAIRELVFIVWVWCGIIQTIMRKKEADGMGMFDFRSRAERERDYQAFFKRVFPEGEPAEAAGGADASGAAPRGRTSPM